MRLGICNSSLQVNNVAHIEKFGFFVQWITYAAQNVVNISHHRSLHILQHFGVLIFWLNQFLRFVDHLLRLFLL